MRREQVVEATHANHTGDKINKAPLAVHDGERCLFLGIVNKCNAWVPASFCGNSKYQHNRASDVGESASFSGA